MNCKENPDCQQLKTILRFGRVKPIYNYSYVEEMRIKQFKKKLRETIKQDLLKKYKEEVKNANNNR